MKELDLSKVHRLFYPDVPAILCASYRDRISAMPVVSYASLSEDPALIGVSCSPDAFTYRLITRSRHFSLCLVDWKQVKAIEFLATHSGKYSRDKLVDSGLRHRRGTKLDVPVILGSVAALECSLSTRKKFGDHALIVGEVQAAHVSGDFNDYWRFHTYRPILYTGWQGRLTTFDYKKRAD